MKRTFFAALMGAMVTAYVMTTPLPAPLRNLVPGLSAEAAGPSTYRQLNLFGEVFERVRSQYVEPMEDRLLIESAIDGIMGSLDPHSSYMPPDAFKNMQVSTRGEFGGLGMEVTLDRDTGWVRVVAPMDDTPAARAGMKSGDKISHIDDEPIEGKTLTEAIELMRGPVNTDITITIQREDEDSFELTLTRAIITIASVRHEVIGDDVGYVRIATFSEKTDSGLQKSMAALKREIDGDMIGVVVDLRRNPGGLLDQAVSVSDAFLDRGEIVSTRGRHARDSKRHNARNGDLSDGKPIVILIDGGSASASEIVAGALQDHHRAILVGTTSFGKGSVQTVIPLSNGNDGALRLTTAKYYTPSGRSIHEKGINPDVCIDVRVKRDEAAEAAIEAVTEETVGEADEIAEEEVAMDCDMVEIPMSEIEAARDDPDYDLADPQLDRAVEVLRSMVTGTFEAASVMD